MKTVESQIIQTYEASVSLRLLKDAQIKKALRALADSLEANTKKILAANKKDLAKYDAENPRIDRLLLNIERIANIANSIRNISKLPNPAGKQLEHKIMPNGLVLEKIAVPLGVVGAIYESRPN